MDKETEKTNQLIKLIKRQTCYNDDNEILELLEKHNNNVESIIKEHYGIVDKKDNGEGKSTNQKAFKTIREFF